MQVTDSEHDITHDITLHTGAPLPFKAAEEKAVVQQGTSFCLLKGTAAQQEGAVEFLKWFTQPEQNLSFSLMSGYSPVTVKANTAEAIEAAYNGDVATPKRPAAEYAAAQRRHVLKLRGLFLKAL